MVRKMPLRCARPDADPAGRLGDGTARRHVGGEHIDLAGRRRLRERPSQVPVPHTGLTRLRVIRPRITAVTARIAPIWSGARLRLLDRDLPHRFGLETHRIFEAGLSRAQVRGHNGRHHEQERQKGDRIQMGAIEL